MGKLVFYENGFDSKTGNLESIVASLSSGHSGDVIYLFCSAQKDDTSNDELVGVYDVAAALSGLNTYSLMSKSGQDIND